MADTIKNGSEKTLRFIELLKKAEGKPVTTGELMRLLDCNRNSVNNYYKRCVQAGNPVKKTMVIHETGYYLECDSDTYEPMTADMVRKYLIMQKIRPGEQKNKAFLLGKNILDEEAREEITDAVGVRGLSKYYSMIDELEKEGELCLIDGRYYPGRKKIPVDKYLDMDTAFEYLERLSVLPPGHYGQKQIASIYEKINTILENGDKDDDAYVVLGRKYSVFNRIRELLESLYTVDYIHKPVRISYRGKGGAEIQNTIAVGLVCYCPEKDKLYIIGKKCGSGAVIKADAVSGPSKKELMIFIDAEKIRKVEEEKGVNRSYQSREYMSVFHKMFSIGNSHDMEKGKVSVSFLREDYIEERLEDLCEYRKESGAHIEIEDDRIIYYDDIMGLDDFFRFLRQFTGKYRIIRSDILKKKKADSIELMLRNYSEQTGIPDPVCTEVKKQNA